MKRLLLTIFGIVVAVNMYGQQTIDLQTGTVTDGYVSTVPVRDVEVSSNSTVVTYIFSKATIMEDDLFEDSYWWKVEGFGIEDVPSRPSVLNRIDRFVIPKGKNASVEVVETSYKDYNYSLAPARQPLADDGDEIYTKQNVQPIDLSIGVYPMSIVEEYGMQSYRGENILSVKVSPIQYDVVLQKVRAYTKIKYKITYSNNTNVTSTSTDDIYPNISSDDNYLRNTTLNVNSQSIAKSIPTMTIPKHYLILSVPDYEAAVNEFAEWKKMMGFNVYVVLKESWTVSDVKNTVRELYESCMNLCYLLIVGDHEDVPAEYIAYINEHTYGPHFTDFYYGCMDGEDDYTPDIHRGRLSVSTASEAQTVVDKIIQYERNPVMTPSFYYKGINCAYFQDYDRNFYADRRFAQTSEDVRDYLQDNHDKIIQRIYYAESNVTPLYWNNTKYSNGEPIPEELHKPGFAWDGDAEDITSAINEGAFYVLHRDHGGNFEWCDPEYKIADINTLSNGNKLPVVFSLNCLTGKFNSGTCFAESFLRKANGGCVGIYAATETSYSGYNDVLAGGLFDAIWPDPGLRIVMPSNSPVENSTPDPVYGLGEILDQGFTRLTEIYGANAPYTLYTKEVFHCFGDPSMQIYTDVPSPFTNVMLSSNGNSITVSLASGPATITFYDMMNGNVASYIGTSVTHQTNNPKNVTICISGHNKIPYILRAAEICIQDETVVGNKIYNAETIKVGSDVTTAKPEGPVVFDGGSIILKADEIEIKSNTTISSGTEFKAIVE